MSKKIFLRAFYLLIICCGLFFIWLSDQYVVPIIMYHSVAKVRPKTANIIDPVRFSWQMDFLKKNGYEVISLAELVEAKSAGIPLSRRSVVLTFDDGYEDNYIRAYEILKEKGFPAIIFVGASQVGDPAYLSWRQIKEMEEFDVTVGSHTLNQAYLPDLSPREAFAQIRFSKNILEEKLNHPVDFLSYPTGGFSEQIKDMVKSSGYLAACTTNRGEDDLNRDLYELKRIRFSNKDNNPVILWAKLSGYYNFFRKDKQPY